MPSPGKASGTGVAAMEAGPSAGPPSSGLQWQGFPGPHPPQTEGGRDKPKESFYSKPLTLTYMSQQLTSLNVGIFFFLTRKQEQGFKDNYNNSVLAKCNVPSFGGINLLRTLKSRNGTN